MKLHVWLYYVSIIIVGKKWKKAKKITLLLRSNDKGATKLPDDKEGEYKSVKWKAKKGWLLVDDAVGNICTCASNCYFLLNDVLWCHMQLRQDKEIQGIGQVDECTMWWILCDGW